MADLLETGLAGQFGPHDQAQIGDLTEYRLDVHTTKSKDPKHYLLHIRRTEEEEFKVYYVHEGKRIPVLHVRNDQNLELHKLGLHHHYKLILENFSFRPHAQGHGKHNHWGPVRWKMKQVGGSY